LAEWSKWVYGTRRNQIIDSPDFKVGQLSSFCLPQLQFLSLCKMQSVKIVQFTDLHHFNNGSKEDLDGFNLITSIVDRVNPDLVVFTGDIIDGRYCGSFSCFENIVRPLIHRKIFWTYVPGNHDDETELFTREDLLKVYSMPYCASRHSSTFTHSINVGPVQVYLIDSNGYLPTNSGEHTAYDYIHQDQIDWYREEATTGEVGVAFFHIPLVEYKTSSILIGKRGEEPCTPQHNSGFFKAIQEKRDIHAMFTGHDHWNDYVAELDGVWLGYGRVTGYTEPSVYSDYSNSRYCPERGGRVIKYNSSSKQLSTWIETQNGPEQGSFLVRDFLQ